jgi:hypothetical protein
MAIWIIPRDHRLEEFGMWAFAHLVHFAAGFAHMTATLTWMSGSTAVSADHVAPTVRLAM